MPKTMIFENGRVIIRGGGMIPVIEPIGKEVSADDLQELFESYGSTQETEDG